MSLTLNWSRFCARAEVENPQALLVVEALETTKSGRGFGAADDDLRAPCGSRDACLINDDGALDLARPGDRRLDDHPGIPRPSLGDGGVEVLRITDLGNADR